MLSDRGIGGVPLKVFTKVGGGIGVFSTVFDLKEDAEKYSGLDFSKAVLIDAGGTVIGAVAAGGLGATIATASAPVWVTGTAIALLSIGVGLFADYGKEKVKLHFLRND